MASSDKIQVDKDKLKEKLEEKFDLSHFDFNAIIRGAQLTLVGGKYLYCIQYLRSGSSVVGTANTMTQPIEHFRTRHSSLPITIVKLP